MMPTPTRSSSTVTTSSATHMALGLSLGLLAACTPFPRKDSVDNRGAAAAELSLAAVDPVLVDSIQPQFQLNNDNGIAEPGETIQVTALLSWQGTATRTLTIGVATSASDTCVASVQSRVQSLVLMGTSVNTTVPVGPLEVRLQTAPCDAGTATFDLEVTVVETGDMLVMPVTFPVMDRDSMVTLQGVAITDGADGALSPGETSTLTVDVKNDGVSTLRNVGVTISDNGSCVSASSNGISGRLINYGDVFAGQVVTLGGNTLSVTADNACATGDTLELTFLVEDASGDQFELPFSTTLQ